MKAVVLAEKPSVAREIARVLKCNKQDRGFFEGPKYVVTWALGHLVTLADPEAYGDRYKSWNVEDLPIIPDKMELVVIKESARQFNVVRNLMKRPDLGELIIATDAGREGELVARWIIKKAGWRKTIRRLWISSQTDKAILDGFNNLKPGRDYDNLYLAAECRAQADWVVGINVTRALTCKYNAQLSAGRVQTPTLAMIVERENEIKKFIPKDYWAINAKVDGFTLLWQGQNSGQSRISNQGKAEEIVAKVRGQMGEVLEVKKDMKRELPPLAYDLTELQRDANRKYGYSAKKTLQLMQSLYENHKLLTYPRTDSRYLTSDIVPTLSERLKSIAVGPYAEAARRILKSKIQTSKRLVDDSKVSDHHAIIPTEQYVNLSSLKTEERHIYDLVIRKFLAVLSAPFEYEQTAVKVSIKGELFSAKGKIVKSKGWKSVYDSLNDLESEADLQEKDQYLPQLQKGGSLKIVSVECINGKTKPPARYTEATLLTAMEHPGKFIEDEKLRETIDKSSGLGTPATRADIIEKLFNTFYVERKGKEIIPTSKGAQLVDLVPADLKLPELTAKWEQQLIAISKGKADFQAFINEMKNYASKLVSNVVASTTTFRHDNITRTKCPECGKYLLEVNGKKGKMLVCEDRGCRYRENVSQISNARCPQCHKKLEIRGSGEKKIFVCSCGYREKLAAFNQRKKEEGKKLGKNEVRQYLSKQKNEKLVNTVLADALAKWNSDKKP